MDCQASGQILTPDDWYSGNHSLGQVADCPLESVRIPKPVRSRGLGTVPRLTWYYFPSGSFWGDTPLSRFCSLCPRKGPLSLSSLSPSIHTEYPKTISWYLVRKAPGQASTSRKSWPEHSAPRSRENAGRSPEQPAGQLQRGLCLPRHRKQKRPAARERITAQQVSWGRDSRTTEQTQQEQEAVA